VFVAEYFKVEEVTETIRIFESIDGTEEKYRQEDFKNDETLEETLLAIGSVEVRQRKIKRKRVRKYIMSGGKVLKMQDILLATASLLCLCTASDGLWITLSVAWVMCVWPKMPSV
jgi:hypothetical protein